jgi:hypothetical protein
MPSSIYTYPKGLTGKDRARDLVFECVSQSWQVSREFVDIWEEGYQNYIVRPLNYSAISRVQTQYPYISSLNTASPQIMMKDMETHANVTIMAANIFARTIGDSEFVRVIDPDPNITATWTRAIDYTFRRSGHTHAYWKTVLNACIYGIGWLKNPVEANRRFMYFPEELPAGTSGATITDYTPRIITDNEPTWRCVNNFRFYPDWTSSPGVGMKWGVEARRSTAAELTDFIERQDSKYVNKTALRRAIDNNVKSFHFGGYGEEWRILQMHGISEEDMALPNAYRPLVFWEFRGEVPWKGIEDPERYRCIIVVNNEVVLDAPQPYFPHPYRAITLLPVDGRPVGLGPAEVGRWEQDATDTLKILELQAAIKSTRMPVLADGSMFDDITELQNAPSGQIIMVDGNPSLATGTIKYDPSPLMAVQANIQLRRQAIREGMGIPDILKGVSAGARTTAEEIRTLSAAGNLPMDIRVKLIEDEDLPNIARDIGARLIWALRDEDDPDTALAIRLGEGAKLEHLTYAPAMQFMGSQSFRARESRSARLERLTNFIMAVPGAINLVNLPQIITDIMASEAPDARTRYLNTKEQAQGQAGVLEALAGPEDASRGMPSPPRPMAVPSG